MDSKQLEEEQQDQKEELRHVSLSPVCCLLLLLLSLFLDLDLDLDLDLFLFLFLFFQERREKKIGEREWRVLFVT